MAKRIYVICMYMYIHHISDLTAIFLRRCLATMKLKTYICKKNKNLHLPLYINFKLNLWYLGINCDVILDL